MKLKAIISTVTLVAIAATVGCGSGGSLVLPKLNGNYSNASLKGSYVYHVHGFDPNGNPYREIGVFTADGNGNITGGTDDSSVSASGTQVSGTYNVSKDGTGFIAINTSLGALNWAITLASTSQLQLIEADSFANGGGTAEFQSPSAIAANLNGTYIFRLHQEASAQNAPNSQVPAAEVGSLAISGSSATGTMDENVAGTFNAATNITATFNAATGPGRGTGTLVDSSTNFTTNFIYYIVDIDKFVMLVSNPGAVGSGTAEFQNGAVANGLSGNYAFGSRGDGSFFAGVATVGQFTASSGTMTGTLDSSVANQNGSTIFSANISSCYTPSANGRVVVSDLSLSTCSSSTSQVFWMVSPSRAFFVNAGNSSVEDGTADLQITQNFALSTFTQQYSMAMDGLDFSFTVVGGQELYSRVGALQFDGNGNVNLSEVVNASGTGTGVNNPGFLTGTYTVGSNGRMVAAVNGGGLNLVMYAVSPSQAYVLQTDSGFTTSGQILLQQ